MNIFLYNEKRTLDHFSGVVIFACLFWWHITGNARMCEREICPDFWICGLYNGSARTLLTITAGDGFWACLVIILASGGLFLLYRCTRFVHLEYYFKGAYWYHGRVRGY